MNLRNVFIPVFLGISALSFSSCDEVNELNITNVSAPIESEYLVQSSDSLAEKTEFVDASTNADYINNRSKIEDIEIERLEYQIKSITPGTADSLIEGRLEFLNPANGNAPELLTLLTNKKLSLNVSYDLPFEPAVAQKLTTIFKSNEPKATLRFKAVANKKPVNFLLAVKFYLKLKVKI